MAEDIGSDDEGVSHDRLCRKAPALDDRLDCLYHHI